MKVGGAEPAVFTYGTSALFVCAHCVGSHVYAVDVVSCVLAMVMAMRRARWLRGLGVSLKHMGRCVL